MRNIPFARPDISDAERNAVLKILEGHVLTHGPECKAFEEEFGGFLGDGASCVTVSSCMAALHLAAIHLGLSEGDEVIVPALTHVATAHAVEWTKARPVFVDCDPATGNITADRIEPLITERTKAIFLVHFAGIPCEMDAIMSLAARRGLPVVEDCALAVGTSWKNRAAGLHGDIGCFSFYPVKHMTTGEGGMFVSRHAPVAQSVARLRAFGVDRTHTERSIPGQYDVPELGLNYRMSEMAAALGRVQVTRLGEFLDRRKANFEAWRGYLAGRPGLSLLDASSSDGCNSHYCLVLRLDGPWRGQRNEMIKRLTLRGVGTSVYYPQPVPRMTYYQKKYGYDAARFPNAEAISDRSLALPVGPHVREDDVRYMAEQFNEVLKELS